MIGYPHVARRRAIQFQHKSRRDPGLRVGQEILIGPDTISTSRARSRKLPNRHNLSGSTQAMTIVELVV